MNKAMVLYFLGVNNGSSMNLNSKYGPGNMGELSSGHKIDCKDYIPPANVPKQPVPFMFVCFFLWGYQMLSQCIFFLFCWVSGFISSVFFFFFAPPRDTGSQFLDQWLKLPPHHTGSCNWLPGNPHRALFIWFYLSLWEGEITRHLHG